MEKVRNKNENKATTNGKNIRQYNHMWGGAFKSMLFPEKQIGIFFLVFLKEFNKYKLINY